MAMVAKLFALLMSLVSGAGRRAAAWVRSTRSSPGRAASLCAVAVLAGALVWRLALAATITVTTTADTVDGTTTSISALQSNMGADGLISLREAVTAALNDAATGPHTVSLPAGTYNLASTQLTIGAAVHIEGAGAATTVISGQNARRVFSVTGALQLSGLTVGSGSVTGDGGCILASGGSLVLTDVILGACTATNGKGGAIAATDTAITLTSSTVQNSRCTGSSGNGHGGGINLSGGSLTVASSTFSVNRANNGGGGAVWLMGTANGSFTDVTFSSNVAGQVGGGALAMNSSGSLSVTRATFSANNGNNGAGGGLYVAAGTATADNATFNTNRTNNGGGAVAVAGGSLTLTNVTVAGNSVTNGAAGLLRSAGTLSLRNTILASNTGGSGNCGGTITNASTNLDSGTTCGFGTANGSRSSSNPVLSALADNGGSTQTMALGSGSPAINAGTSTGAPTTDQRGYSRNGATDVGAFEFDGGGVAMSLPLYLASSGVPSAGLSMIAPTNTTLANYDSGRDSAAGLLLAKGGSGAGETDSTKYQRWLSGTNGITLSGTVQLHIWSAVKDFESTKAGSLTAYLRQCNSAGSACSTIGTATLTSSPWSAGSSTWVERILDFGTVSHTVPAGSTLEVKVIVNDASDDDMWLAYATTGFPSRLAGASTLAISGTVFEDRDYGGGAGRSLADSGGTGVGGARVELYDSAGAFVTSTTTTSGAYSFAGLAAGSYHVRVASQTVASGRSGSIAALRGVMTFRTNAASGTAVAVTDHVGGTNPALADPGNGASGTAFDTTSYAFSAGLAGTAHAVAPVTLGSADIAGVDFGFNFNTVVNTNDSGQGSLRQAITNANTLGGDASLAQAGRVAANENLIFMISNGSSGSGGSLGLTGGLRSGLNEFSGGVASIALASALPAMTTPMVIDAQAQPGWTAAPIVEFNGTSAGASADGLSVQGGASVVRGLVINRFGGSGVQVLNLGGNTVAGNYVGTNAAGTAASPNGGNGINLWNSSSNTLGGTAANAVNVLSGNTGNGIAITGTSSGNLIQGNLVGTNATGTARVQNGSIGIYLDSAGNTVGGTTAAARNLISGNTWQNLAIDSGASNTTVQGNYIGTNAAGSAALTNGAMGVDISSTGNLIGGTTAAAANLISGNGGDAIRLQASASGNVIQGNSIGLNAAGSAALSNNGHGVNVMADATNNTIGGTATGASNVIAYNAQRGVSVVGANATGNRIVRNAIYGHTAPGIDIAATGRTANNGSKDNALGNAGMDTPVFTSATLSAGTLTVAGYVGSAADQSTFGGATVEVFKTASDGSGYGQAELYLGSFTADASGNFSGSVAATLVDGEAVTATASDAAGNTSEFGPDAAVIVTSISGTVFEDAHYGGGAGRSLAASGGTGVGGATVEIYSAATGLVATTTTASDGRYAFTGIAPGGYFVRALPATVRSQRAPSASGVLPVQTWRYEASWRTPAAVVNEVGGARPDTPDSPAAVTPTWTQCATESGGSSNPCAFTGTRVVRFGADTRWTVRVATGGVACAHTVFGDPAPGTSKTCQLLEPHLHSASSVHVADSAAASVDFGFNFSAVVNTNDSGAGSLRQAITNANTLGGDSSLVQSGRTAAIEHLVFMLPNGSDAAGLRAGLDAFSGGVASIAPTSALPSISTSMVIDAQTQPGWSSNPIVELRGDAAGSTHGLTLSAGTSTVRGLIVNRYTGNGIVTTGGSGHTIQGSWVGTDASGSAAAANTAHGISLNGGSGHRIGGTLASQRNVVSGNGGNGVDIPSGSGHVVEGNHIGLNAAGTAAVGNAQHAVRTRDNASSVLLGGTAPGAGNVMSGNGGTAIVLYGSPSTVQGNLIGLNAAGTAAIPNGQARTQFSESGIFAGSGGHLIGGSSAAARNVVAGHASYGIWLNSAGNTVQGNYVGTNAAGTVALPNLHGVYSKGSSNVIGGTAPGAGNLLSGNTRSGVLLPAEGSGTAVQGNVVGLNAAGTAPLPNGDGVVVRCTSACTVGGTASGAGNTISGNTGNGVVVEAGSGHAILGNTIHGNGGLGIDLGDNGVTANDDALTAGQPNGLMDHPVLTSGHARGNQLTVAGHTGTAPGRSVFAGSRIEFFVSDGDASGFGEGRTYLGALTADGSGNFSGTLTMAVGRLTIGTVLTATATATDGNTSEFGAQFVGLVVDFVVNTTADDADASIGDGDCLTAAGFCSLRAAIAELNAWSTLPATPLVAFDLPGCSVAGAPACSIAPGTALPAIGRAMLIDGQTQPGWTQTPWVELDGRGAPSFASGLAIDAAGTTVRGLVIGGFGENGIRIAANDAVVEGNHIGVLADGSTARGNGSWGGLSSGSGGVYVTSGTGVVVGGTTPSQRNVLSGNRGAGVWVHGGSATIIGNRIGTDASGMSAVSNGRWGVHVTAGTGTLIGGAASGQGNLISGNVGVEIGGIYLSGTGHTVQGNTIGMNVDGTAALPNGDAGSVDSSGIDVRNGTGHLIGGTGTGEGNLIAGNQGHGVRVSAAAVRILGNRMQGNLWLGIDLGADGVSANDGVFAGSQPNNGMDHPVLSAAGVAAAGTSLTVYGAIGTGSGQAAFAGSRVEVFKAAADATGYGEGQVYLGALTADANGRFSGTFAVAAGQVAVGDVLTATATDPAGRSSEFGPNLTAVDESALAPGRFDAFDTTAPAGALSGVLTTRVAGTASSVAVVAIDTAGTALQTSFEGSVTLEWMDARDNSGALDAGNCRASWVSAGSAGSAVFTSGSGGRSTAALTPAAAGREWRLRISHAGPAGTVTACSGDALAVRPDSLQITGVTDGDAATAGTTRALDTVADSGGRVHRAGRPFSLRAAAFGAGGAVAGGYDGAPALTLTRCLLPASGCTPGTLTAPALVASAGLVAADTLSYSEVGAIELQLTDDDFAAIDAADTPLAQRRLQSAAVGVGRFVPDSYGLTLARGGVLRTVQGACAAPGAGFTYFGQAFGWATAPQVTVTASNAAGSTTVNWTGSLMKLVAASHATDALSATATPAVALGSALAARTVTDTGNGTAQIDMAAGDVFALTRDATPRISTVPVFGWSLTLADSSEAAVAGNPTLGASLGQAGVPFDSGGTFHTGRVRLNGAHGDMRVGVRALVELQKYTAAGWTRLSEDNGCLALPAASFSYRDGSGRFAGSGNQCAAPLQADATLAGGRGWLVLPKSPGNLPGSLTLQLNLGGTAAPTGCSAAGTEQAAAALGLTHLRGAWNGATGLDGDPSAVLTWGVARREFVLRRERTN